MVSMWIENIENFMQWQLNSNKGFWQISGKILNIFKNAFGCY